MATLGYSTTAGSAGFGLNPNYVMFARYVSDGSGGNVSALHAYVNNITGAEKYGYLALYNDDAANNLPGTIVASQVTVTCPASTLVLASANYSCTLSASTSYWLAFVSADLEIYYTSTGSGDSGYYNLGSTTLPNDFGDLAASDRTWEYVFYADYASGGSSSTTMIQRICWWEGHHDL